LVNIVSTNTESAKLLIKRCYCVRLVVIRHLKLCTEVIYLYLVYYTALQYNSIIIFLLDNVKCYLLAYTLTGYLVYIVRNLHQPMVLSCAQIQCINDQVRKGHTASCMNYRAEKAKMAYFDEIKGIYICQVLNRIKLHINFGKYFDYLGYF